MMIGKQIEFILKKGKDALKGKIIDKNRVFIIEEIGSLQQKVRMPVSVDAYLVQTESGELHYVFAPQITKIYDKN